MQPAEPALHRSVRYRTNENGFLKGHEMFDVQQHTDGTVIHVQADMDIASAPAFDSVIRTAELEPGRRVVVSLEDCAYCDSTGLSVILRAKKRLGAGLKIVVPAHHRMRRIFELTNMTDYLRLHGSVAEALIAP